MYLLTSSERPTSNCRVDVSLRKIFLPFPANPAFAFEAIIDALIPAYLGWRWFCGSLTASSSLSGVFVARCAASPDRPPRAGCENRDTSSEEIPLTPSFIVVIPPRVE